MILQSEGGAVGTEDSLTSTEFDRFLAERAAAAENLPTISREEKSGEVNDAAERVALNPSSESSSANEQRRPGDAKANPKPDADSLIQF